MIGDTSVEERPGLDAGARSGAESTPVRAAVAPAAASDTPDTHLEPSPARTDGLRDLVPSERVIASRCGHRGRGSNPSRIRRQRARRRASRPRTGLGREHARPLSSETAQPEPPGVRAPLERVRFGIRFGVRFRVRAVEPDGGGMGCFARIWTGEEKPALAGRTQTGRGGRPHRCAFLLASKWGRPPLPYHLLQAADAAIL